MGLDGWSVGNSSGITASKALNPIGSGRGAGEDDVCRVSLAKSGMRRMGSRDMWSDSRVPRDKRVCNMSLVSAGTKQLVL